MAGWAIGAPSPRAPESQAGSQGRKLQLPNALTRLQPTTAAPEVEAGLSLSLHTLLGQRYQDQNFQAKSLGVAPEREETLACLPQEASLVAFG